MITYQLLKEFDGPVICASFCKKITLKDEILSPLIFIMRLHEAYANGELELYELRSTGIRNFKFTIFLEKGRFVVPSRIIQERFVDKILPLIDSIQNLGARNANLRQTRDLLLPKLISGAIDVSQLDINRDSTI